MKTIEIKIYKFAELSEQAKNTAIENYRNNLLTYDYIYDEAYETVKQFNNVFNTKEGRNSWLNINTDSMNENILNLTGFRLRKYLLNNYSNVLYKNAYRGSLKNKVYHKNTRIKEYKNGRFFCAYYSKVFFDTDCNLTGVCYDMDILKPIYDFINNGYKTDSFKYLTFEMLLNECIENLEKSIENEIEYRNSDEEITHEIEANDYDFTEKGKPY